MMERILNQIHKTLIKNKKTLAVAESCTGGLLCALLTSLSGSSKYFISGVIAYNNKAKTGILRVPARIILRKGTVCPEVAAKMAEQARRLAKTDLGIGITGIAGPTGATTHKPVGTVFIAIESANKKICKEFHFKGNRAAIRKTSALKALKLLKNIL